MRNYIAVLGPVLVLTAPLAGSSAASDAPDGTGGGHVGTDGGGQAPEPLDNKTTITSAMDALFVNMDVAAVDTYFVEPYLQHNPTLPSSLAALRSAVGSLKSAPGFKYERSRAIADGDLLAIHSRYTMVDGATRSSISIAPWRTAPSSAERP